MIAYHVTPRSNLGSIKRWGLIPRNTCEHHYPGISSNGGVLAVYVLPAKHRHLVREWAGNLRNYAPLTVVKLNIKGLPWDPDPATSAFRILERIPPSMIVGWEHIED